MDGLTREPCTRTDILFVKKNGAEIFSSMFISLEKTNNTIKNMNAVYTTAALFCVELLCEDTLFDFVRLIISFQDLAITSSLLNPSQKIHLHVIALSLFTLVAHCLPILQDYCNKVQFYYFSASMGFVFNCGLNDLLFLGHKRKKRECNSSPPSLENAL